MKLTMTHTEFNDYTKKLFGFATKITRSRVEITGYVKPLDEVKPSLITFPFDRHTPKILIPEYFSDEERACLRLLNIYKLDERKESITSHCLRGGKVSCIKVIREQTALGLKQAKDLIELNQDTWAKLAQ